MKLSSGNVSDGVVGSVAVSCDGYGLKELPSPPVAPHPGCSTGPSPNGSKVSGSNGHIPNRARMECSPGIIIVARPCETLKNALQHSATVLFSGRLAG